MAYKSRFPAMDLLALRILDVRMKLSYEEHRYYLNKEKGLEGEMQFDLLTEQLQSDCLILNDLLLKVDNTTFQLDTTIIYEDIIYPFEVKNNEGDFIYTPEKLEATYGKEYKNPLDQLKRSKFQLGQLLRKLDYQFPIEGFVVFINPEFTLFQGTPKRTLYFSHPVTGIFEKI